MINSALYKYYRSLNTTIQNELLIEQLGKQNIFIILSGNTFQIYDIDKFNILFTGPYIQNITKQYFHNDKLYICSSNNIFIFRRSIHLNTLAFNSLVRNILILENIMFVNLEDNKLHIIDESNVYNKILDDVTLVFHPKTYVNKILIEQSDKVVLYNFVKDKIIYEYKNIHSGILSIRNTFVLDIVGIMYEDKIDIIDLKKDEILDTLELFGTRKEGICSLDFADNKLLYVRNHSLHIYDLVNKRKMLQKDNIIDCKFLDDKYLLVTRSDDVAIYEVKDKNIDLIKHKIMNNRNISDIKFINNKNFVIINGTSVMKFSLYNDNNRNRIYYNKNIKEQVEALHEESFKYAIYKDNVVVYKDNTLYKIDLINNKAQIILRNQIQEISLYQERVAILTDKLIILNINNKLVYYKDIPVLQDCKIIYYGDNIIYYTEKEVVICNLARKDNKNLQISEDNPLIKMVSVKDDIIVVITVNNLYFFNFRDTEPFRIFKIENIVDYDINNKVLAVLVEDCVFIYDILSNILIEDIQLKDRYKLICFSGNNFFITLVSERNEVHLLCRKVFNIQMEETKEIENDLMDINLQQVDKSTLVNIKWNINDVFNIEYKDLNLDEILENILGNLEKDFLKYNIILNKVLKKYSADLNKDKLREIYRKYKEIGESFMEDYIRIN